MAKSPELALLIVWTLMLCGAPFLLIVMACLWSGRFW